MPIWYWAILQQEYLELQWFFGRWKTNIGWCFWNYNCWAEVINYKLNCEYKLFQVQIYRTRLNFFTEDITIAFSKEKSMFSLICPLMILSCMLFMFIMLQANCWDFLCHLIVWLYLLFVWLPFLCINMGLDSVFGRPFMNMLHMGGHMLFLDEFCFLLFCFLFFCYVCRLL